MEQVYNQKETNIILKIRKILIENGLVVTHNLVGELWLTNEEEDIEIPIESILRNLH